ncbi:MAG: carboxypeptidase regulatory-like domain-containing protein [Bryobacteraceae bacterium]|nr:carboxypeptidase regulatory-like domain-containing protein [Bryobacteraceae bacterium]
MWIATVVQAALLLAQLQIPRPVPPAEVEVERDVAPAKHFLLSGVVQDSVTGQGVPRAVVVLQEYGRGEQGPGSRQTTTGEDGRFQFTNVKSGGADIRIHRLGYGSGYSYIEPDRVGDLSGLTVKLEPLAAISGRVVDDQDQALPGIAVQAVRLSTVQGVRQSAIEAGFKTDDRGEFRLWHLRPGRYLLRAIGRKQTGFYVGYVEPFRSRESYGPAYYPDGDSADTATVFRLKPGEELAAGFKLTGRQAYNVSGRIAGVDRSAPLNATLLKPGGDEAGATFRVNVETGAFTLTDVAPGDYTIVITESTARQGRTAMAEVRVRDRDVTGAVMEMSAAQDMTFQLVEEGLAAEGRQAGVTLLLIPQTTSSNQWARPITVFLRPGTAEVKQVVGPGRYVVKANFFGGYVESVMAGETDLLSAGLVVMAGVAPAPVKVKVVRGGGKISIKLPDGARTEEERSRATQSMLQARLQTQSGMEAMDAQSKLIIAPAQGAWTPAEFIIGMTQMLEAKPFAPGEYLVFPLSDQEAEYHDKSKIAADLSKAKRFRVTEGQTTEVELDLEGEKR